MTPRAIFKRVLGSIASVSFGWIVAMTVCIVLASFTPTADPSFWSSLRTTIVLGGLYVGVPLAVELFVLWVVLLLPLYVLVPRRRRLWRWPVCVCCGGLIGSLPGIGAKDWLPATLGASVGASICLFGSLTRNYFDGPADA